MEIRNTPSFAYPWPFSLSGNELESYEKKVEALTLSYQNPIPLELKAEIAYRVVSITAPKPAMEGTLTFGVTYLNPYQIEGEYSLTRGHFHANKNYDEYYFGLSGEGFLLYWDGENEVFAEKVYPGSVHYINGKYAHRLINTHASEIMAVGACWNVLAGHDYESIDKSGFPVRCFNVEGKPEWKGNNR